MLSDDIKCGESDVLEFKRNLSKDMRPILMAAIAMSNAKGGRILIGVTDDREVIGVDNPFVGRDRVTDYIITNSIPPIYPNSRVVAIDHKIIIVIEIPVGLYRPYHLKSKDPYEGTFIRVSASNRHVSKEMMMDLYLQGQNRSYDTTDFVGADRSETEESISVLCGYLSDRSGREVTEVNLENMGLLRRVDGRKVPSIGFMLLSRNPFGLASIKCARFIGSDMTES